MEETFDCVINTTNTESRYNLKWCIQHFSMLPGDLVSTEFSLVSGFPKKWFVSARFSNSNECRIHLNYSGGDSKAIRIMYNATLLNSLGTPLEHENGTGILSSDVPFELLTFGDHHSRLPYHIDDVYSLPGNQIVFQCSMKIFGYGLVTTQDLFQGSPPDFDVIQLQNDFRRMLDSGSGADVEIKIGKHVLKAHKCVLSFRSEVFRKMFSVDDRHDVRVDDIPVNVFESVLAYMYTGEVNGVVLELSTLELYSAACRYELKGLQKMCAGELVQNLSVDDVCDVLTLAEQGKDMELVRYTKAFISSHFHEVSKTKRWRELEQSAPSWTKQIETSLNCNNA